MVTLAHALTAMDKEPSQHYALHLIPASERASFQLRRESKPSFKPSMDLTLAPLMESASKLNVTVRPLSFVSAEPAADICRTALAKQASLILLGWHKPLLSQTLLGGTVREVMQEAQAKVAVLVDRGLTSVRRVLVPFMGSPHDRAALRLARRLMRNVNAEVTVLHVTSPERGTSAKAQIGAAPRGVAAAHPQGRAARHAGGGGCRGGGARIRSRHRGRGAGVGAGGPAVGPAPGAHAPGISGIPARGAPADPWGGARSGDIEGRGPGRGWTGSLRQAMHLGATIRLLRVDAGLSLRDLARRIGVSSAYLSRVEHGLDAVPTPERLTAIARELDVPPTLLMDVSHRVNPFVASYLEQVPGAGGLFLDIARRRLTSAQLARVREFLDAEFPVRGAPRDEPTPTLAPLLAADRIILKLSCTSVEDARDMAVGRLCAAHPGLKARPLIEVLARREAEASCAVGNGVAVPHAAITGVPELAALVTLAKPLRHETPDGQPLRLLILMVGSDRGRAWLTRLAHVARLSSHGLATHLQDTQHPREVLSQPARAGSPALTSRSEVSALERVTERLS